MKRLISTAAPVPAILLVLAGPVSAAANPAGTGQPGAVTPNGAACFAGAAILSPAGFLNDGFANAGTRYAGSPDTGSLNSGNWHAFSEYDIACYQVSQTH